MVSSPIQTTSGIVETEFPGTRDQIFLNSWHQGLISRNSGRFKLLKLVFRLERRLPSWLSPGSVIFAITSLRLGRKKYPKPILATESGNSQESINQKSIRKEKAPIGKYASGKLKLVVITLLVVLPILAWIASRSSYRATVQAQSVQVAGISQLADQAIIFLETGERQQAEKLLAQAREKFAALPKSAQEAHLYVMAKLLATEEQLSGRFEINQPNFLLSFSQILPNEEVVELAGLEISNNVLYTVNLVNNNIYKIDLAGSEIVLIGKDFKDGDIQDLALDPKGNVYFYYSGAGLFRYEPTTQGYFGVDVGFGSNENPPTDLGFFGDQLYTLSARGRTIYRHGPATSGFGQGDSWISEAKTDLSQATSFAIDGDIYVALSSGEIIKFNRGQRVNFSSPARLLKKDSNPVIKTRGAEDLLFVLETNDNDFFVLDKTGVLLNEYKLNNISDIKDFVVLDNNSSMLVLAGDELYQIPLKLPLPK